MQLTCCGVTSYKDYIELGGIGVVSPESVSTVLSLTGVNFNLMLIAGGPCLMYVYILSNVPMVVVFQFCMHFDRNTSDFFLNIYSSHIQHQQIDGNKKKTDYIHITDVKLKLSSNILKRTVYDLQTRMRTI